MQPRYYQSEAIDAVYKALQEREDNPCIVLPTAAGKTLVIATLCADTVNLWNGRALILSHVKELLEQSANTLRKLCPDVAFGVYSAGLGRKDTLFPVIIAGIQSAYKNAAELGRFDIVIVDEAHLIPPDGEGMYQTLLTDLKKVNPGLRIIGLTATPYRLTSGVICSKDNILNHICYEIGVKELINKGYLCKLKSKGAKTKLDTSKLKVTAGEFNAKETEALYESNCDASVNELKELSKDRKSILIFCTGIDHAKHVAGLLESSATIFGDTPSEDRARIINEFREGKIRYLVNVGVLTTGFDAPNIDCVALLRPTLSPGLYYQMVGRGFRLSPSKENCLILDFGGNVMRHGPVDMIKAKPSGMKAATPGYKSEPVVKECPQCQSLVAAGWSKCPDCGFEFPKKNLDKVNEKIDKTASNRGIISGETATEELTVISTDYAVHRKKGWKIGDPLTMRVIYMVAIDDYKCEWVCFEHTGYARDKAVKWWQARTTLPVPKDTEEAVELCLAGALDKRTKEITMEYKAGEFDRIVAYKLETVSRAPFDEPEMMRPEEIEAQEFSDQVPF